MTNATLTQMLLSGFAGALFAAGLNYVVQSALAARNKRAEERRLAFVHFVRVSNVVTSIEGLAAFLSPLKSILAAMCDKDLKLSQKLAAEFYAAVKFGKAFDGKDLKTLEFILDTVEGSSSEYLKFDISPESLSKLPSKTVAKYFTLSTSATALIESIKIIRTFIRENKESVIELEALYAQWTNAVMFFNTAKDLQDELRKWGHIPEAEAEKIRKYQRFVVQAYFSDVCTNATELPKALGRSIKNPEPA